MNFENPLPKNVALWQQFTTTYSENMMALFEKNLEQSQMFQQQMQIVVSQVVNSQFDLMLTSLKTLEKQRRDLSAQVSQNCGASVKLDR